MFEFIEVKGIKGLGGSSVAGNSTGVTFEKYATI